MSHGVWGCDVLTSVSKDPGFIFKDADSCIKASAVLVPVAT